MRTSTFLTLGLATFSIAAPTYSSHGVREVAKDCTVDADCGAGYKCGPRGNMAIMTDNALPNVCIKRQGTQNPGVENEQGGDDTASASSTSTISTNTAAAAEKTGDAKDDARTLPDLTPPPTKGGPNKYGQTGGGQRGSLGDDDDDDDDDDDEDCVPEEDDNVILKDYTGRKGVTGGAARLTEEERAKLSGSYSARTGGDDEDDEDCDDEFEDNVDLKGKGSSGSGAIQKPKVEDSIPGGSGSANESSSSSSSSTTAAATGNAATAVETGSTAEPTEPAGKDDDTENSDCPALAGMSADFDADSTCVMMKAPAGSMVPQVCMKRDMICTQCKKVEGTKCIAKDSASSTTGGDDAAAAGSAYKTTEGKAEKDMHGMGGAGNHEGDLSRTTKRSADCVMKPGRMIMSCMTEEEIAVQCSSVTEDGDCVPETVANGDFDGSHFGGKKTWTA